MTQDLIKPEWSLRNALCVATAALALGSAAQTVMADDDAGLCPYTVSVAGNAPNCGFWGYSILQPTSINNLGHWVGYRYKCPENLLGEIPILWTPEGGLVNIPVPPQTSRCWAYGMNDIGTVVGVRSGEANGQTHGNWACVWLPDGQFTEIPPFGGNPPESRAAAVNNSGVVVGWRKGLGGTSAAKLPFAWHNGEITDLDPLPYGHESAEARDVSDSGYIVGQFGDDSTGTGRGFRWKDGNVEILQPLPGALASNAKAVTNAGVAYGECRFQSGSVISYRAAWWGLDGVPIELPPLPGYSSWGCRDANSNEAILGSVSKPTQPGLPSSQEVVWVNGVPYPIKGYLKTPTPSQYAGAKALNDLGQIVCKTSVPPGGGAWVLTPSRSVADLNGDCAVDGTDLSVLLQQWGTAPDAPVSADFNHDGTVDGADLGVLLGAWTGNE